MVLAVIIFLILIVLSGFFSSTETAFFNFTPMDLLRFQKSRDRKLNLVSKLMMRPNQVLTSILIGNNMVNIMIVLDASYLLSQFELFPDPSTGEKIINVIMDVFIISGILLLFSEILPKSFALRYSYPLAKINVYPFLIFHKTLGQLRIRFLASFVVKKLLLVIQSVFGKEEETVDHSDIKKAVEMGKKEGHLSALEADIADRLLNFKNLSVEEILLDRSKIPLLESSDDIQKGLDICKKNQVESLPVYNGKKDIVEGVFESGKGLLVDPDLRIETCLSAPQFLPKVNASEGMLEMLEAGEKLRVVVDEFGAYCGVIFYEDILNYLTQKSSKMENFSKSEADKGKIGFHFSGDEKIENIEAVTGDPLPKGDYQTLGGYLEASIRRIPSSNEWLVVNGRKFYIEEARPNRIIRVYIPRKG